MTEVTQPKRTRDQSGKHEQEDIRFLVNAIQSRSEAGLKVIGAFKQQFGLDILDAKERPGNRGVHYDFLILVGSEWKKVEHKGSRRYVPIAAEQTPWAAGVQFHNGGCDKYTISKQYARLWYDTYIGSGQFKREWNLTSELPTFEEWFARDAKVQGDPGTAFGKELKETVRKAKGSLRAYRQSVNTLFTPTEEDLTLFKQEALKLINEVLREKDYWLTIHGDLTKEFYCQWYPPFTVSSMDTCVLRKEKDIWFDFQGGDKKFCCILRWGKGAGFSNLRIDAR